MRYDIAAARSKMVGRAPYRSPDGDRASKYATADKEPAIVFSEAGARVRYPRYSPSGDRLVFLVDRAGTRALMLAENGKAAELIPAGSAGLYHPRFVDEETLILGVEHAGELVTQLLDISTGRRSTLLRDPVGVYGAVPLPALPDTNSNTLRLLYASYRSDGNALFTATTDLPESEVPLTSPAEVATSTAEVETSPTEV
ncbi:MAG: hypothetical protein ABR590_06415, partial [Spirochaetia bacterium]